MFLLSMLLLALSAGLVFTTTGWVGKALSACATLVCYLGVIIFITLTFTQAVRNSAKH